MGNFLALGILLGWPLVTLVLFLTMSSRRAIISSLIAGYLLIPIDMAIDFPGVPTLDKTSIPNLATFLLAFGLKKSNEFKWPRSTVVNLLLVLYVFGPLITGFNNTDPWVLGPLVLPGMSLYDSLSSAATHAIDVMPFVIAAAMLGNERGHRDLIWLFALAGLAYTPLILIEVVKGPFLEANIYHIAAQRFGQQIRDGGFRAIVFIGHGLFVSSFIAMAAIAALGLWRSRRSIFGIPAWLCVVVLLTVLILNKSVGAMVLGVFFMCLVTFLTPRRVILASFPLAAMVMTYPMLRASQLVPVNAILSVAKGYSSERGQSFEFRLQNEEILLARARERPWLGWGTFGRNRVFRMFDWGGVGDVSVTDGQWIIIMGSWGWIGYIASFGLLCYPFLHLVRLRRQDISPASAAVAAMLMFNLLDLIPNSSLRPHTWLMAGALAGLLKIRQAARKSHLAPAVAASQRSAATAS